MTDFFIIAILVMILGGAALYLYKAKKRGVQCIGCPDAKTCGGNCSACCGCGGPCNAKK